MLAVQLDKFLRFDGVFFAEARFSIADDFLRRQVKRIAFAIHTELFGFMILADFAPERRPAGGWVVKCCCIDTCWWGGEPLGSHPCAFRLGCEL